MVDDAEIHTLAAPYALHSLRDGDAERFERHIRHCDACRIEVDELRETLTRLGVATSVPPPERMKSEVLRRVADARPLPPMDEASAGQRANRSGFRAWRRWCTAVAMGVAAVMTAGVVVLGLQLDRAQDSLQEVRAIETRTREVVAAPDMEMVRAVFDGSSGFVLIAPTLGTVVVRMSAVAPAPAQHTYQLWFIGVNGARSAGLLGDPENGHLGPFAADGLANGEDLGLTVEPVGGSDQPTDPIMLIKLGG